MRVLFVTRSLQTTPGGMQATAKALIKALEETPDVELVVCGWSGSKWLLPIFFVIATMRAFLFRGKCVHFGDAAFAPVIACLTFLRPRLRVTCTVHGLDIVFPNRLYQALLPGLRRCHAVAAVSRATAEAAKRIGVSAERILVIPWGVTADCLARPQPSVPTLVSVGRQIRRKGTAWFLEYVFPGVLRAFPDVHYAIVGAGPQVTVIRETIDRLGLQDSVRLAGVATESERDALVRSASALVMPNIPVAGDMEGFGMACIEASAIGVPVVAARLEGIVDAVIEGETGVLFAPLDAADAERAICQALGQHWDAAAVQSSCRKHFAIATVALRYVTTVFSSADHRDSHRG